MVEKVPIRLRTINTTLASIGLYQHQYTVQKQHTNILEIQALGRI
jgi:hypothetical protein